MFEIKFKKGNVRTIILRTKNGEIKTPFFMPDATRAFVRSVDNETLRKIGLEVMLINTYHLYLNPSIKTIRQAGGVHKFMNWSKPLLSDSGGYQIFSLIHKNPNLGKITENKAIFHSPIDGTKHILTPEKSIEIQFDLGVDMMVCLDDPPPNDYPRKKIEAAVERTVRWAERCMIEYKRQLKLRKIKKKDRPLIFCVIQGGKYIDLRKKCAEKLIKIGSSTKGGPVLGWDGYGFGARHIDAEGKFMEEVVRETARFIPKNSLRFALGVGKPEDIVKCFFFGWDMFDCVIPTREGRHGRLFLWKQAESLNSKLKILNKIQNPKSKEILNARYKIQNTNFYQTININNAKYKNDFSPIDENCNCELCQNYTRAYLHHLFSSRESLGMRLATIHNLKFYVNLMKSLRKI